LPQFTGAGSIVPAESARVSVSAGDTTAFAAGWQHFTKKIPVGHVEPDYELMNYSIPESQPAVDFPGRHAAPTHLSKICNALGWSEIHKPATQLLTPYCR